MGDPVTAGIALGAMAGGAALQGVQQKNAYKTQAAQLRTEKKAIETNAAIQQAERLNKLKSIIATQNAAFAMSGQTAGVGSASALQSKSMSEASKEQRYSNLQTKISTSGLDYNIWSSGQAAKTAMLNSFITTGINLGTKVGEAYVAGSFSKGK